MPMAPMTLTARILPPEDWARLAPTPLDPRPLDPAHSAVVVVEDAGGTVIACVAGITVVHLEGLWIDPAHRQRAGAARSLLDLIVSYLLSQNVIEVLTSAETSEMEAFLRRVGGRRLPGTHWVLPLEGLAVAAEDQEP